MSGGSMVWETDDAPKYWMYETGGRLAIAVKRLLGQEQGRLQKEDIALLRAYFRQWIFSSVWDKNPNHTEASRAGLARLRESVQKIDSLTGVREWLARACAAGMDPL